MSAGLRAVNELSRHMEWADALIWRAVRESPADGEVRGKLHHLHTVQHAYLQIWRGETVTIPAESDIGDLESWAREFHQQYPEYLKRLDEPALERTVQIPWAEEVAKRWGSYSAPTLMQTILQVAMHSTYHRGQVNQRLRGLGIEPPLTDFIAWLWKGQPSAEWGVR
jgi:uncharacterized damage-inducible protein DinB